MPDLQIDEASRFVGPRQRRSHDIVRRPLCQSIGGQDTRPVKGSGDDVKTVAYLRVSTQQQDVRADA